MMENKPICLQDLTDEVNASRCLATGKTENILSGIVDEWMGLLTSEYIRQVIIDKRTDSPSSSSVSLIYKKYDMELDLSHLFYECIGHHTESIESRIESLIDTTTMSVAFNHDAKNGWFIVYLYWDIYIHVPVFFLRRPMSVFLFGILLLCFFILTGITIGVAR